VRSVPIPEDVNARAEYLVGEVVRRGASPAAGAWIATLLSPEGREVLARHGFGVE